MGIWESLGLALSLSVDALVCSIIYGKKNFSPKNRLRFAFFTALTFGLFQAVMPVIGFYAGSSIVHVIEKFDHWVAFLLLAAVSFNMLKEAFGDEEGELKRISLLTLLTLGVATSIDALALGFSIGLIYDSIAFFAALTGICCFVISFGGFMVGQYLSRIRRLDRILNLAGALTLLCIGFGILHDHNVF